MLQLGFVTAILPELSLEQVFQHAAEIGYDCVEVMCWPVGKSTRRYAGITHINVDELGGELGGEPIENIKALSDRYQVSISGLGYYPNPLSPDESERETSITHIKKVISACQSLGLTRMNSFIGRDWQRSIDDNWPMFLDVWRPLIEHAEACGVRVGIENCPMSFTADEWPGGKNLAHSPAIWRRMFRDIESDHFGLNYDPSHMLLQQMDYLAPMREFADKLVHVHAKDLRIDQEKLDDVGVFAHPNEFHSPKLPGLGQIDWGQFFATLTDAGYRGPVCVEVEDRAYEGTLEDRLTALRQSHQYLRQFIA